MRKLLLSCLALGFATSCGGPDTDSSGTGTTPAPTTFCGSLQVGAGLICDTSTTPHTLRIDFGTEAGKVAEGADARFPNPNKGKFLGLFTPTVAQANPPNVTQPGGLMTGRGGGIIYNAATANVGIKAADEICASIVNWSGKTEAVPGAHACSNDELLANAHAGNIPVSSTGMAYIMGPFGGFTGGSGFSGHTNMNGSCGNWTYDSGDLWTATTWTVVDQNDKALFGAGKAVTVRFQSDTTASCGAVRPIACCE